MKEWFLYLSNIMRIISIVFSIFFLYSCTTLTEKNNLSPTNSDTILIIKNDTDISATKRTESTSQNSIPESLNPLSISTGNTTPEQIVDFAKSLIGVTYKYGATDPEQGFDCSGFITYVFNHFNIKVPRSSVEFTNVPEEISLSEAKPGDLILFTGTDSTIRIVGHMGIITANENNEIQFIQSTSGKAYGVTITPLSTYYMGRFMKVIRIFHQNN